MSEDLLRQYIEAHNRGVRIGDFAPLVELFAHDGELSFRGLPRDFGPFSGRSEIAGAFAAHPPDDELVLDEVKGEEEDAVDAQYRWRDPGSPGGRLHLRASEGRIAELTIHIDPEDRP